MSERTWSIRLSVDDLNASIYLLESDSEVAAWTRGLMRGLNNGEAKDSASSAYSSGWEIGKTAREKADRIRAGLAENGSAGGRAKASNCQANAKAIATADATPIAEAFALAEPRTKNVEQETKNTERKTKATRVAPPSEAEWVAYCSETWPDWHPQRSAESWAYYESVGWRTRAGALKDWRSAARTAHGNAREWNKLQPVHGGDKMVPPTVEEWMAYGQEVATTSRTRGGATWPRDLAVSAYHQCAANGWKGVADWKAKLSAECLRWVGTQNGMGR